MATVRMDLKTRIEILNKLIIERERLLSQREKQIIKKENS